MRSRVLRGLAALAVMSGSLVLAAGGAAGQVANQVTGSDALQSRVRTELAVFTNWLKTNGAQGYVGELGWPNNADTAQWNALAQVWYQDAAAANVWASNWATGEWWGTTYKLSSYVWNTSTKTLSAATSSAAVIEAQGASERRGVNVNGADFGPIGTGLNATSTLSNANPGVYDKDWHYDKQESFDYLASRGIGTVRLAFRWERLQPALGGPLDPTELGRLVAAVGRAKQAGLNVILNPQNYGAYWLFDGTQGVRQPIGSTAVSQAQFADLWRRLSQQFSSDPGVLGYGLMNEPVGLPSSGTTTSAQVWEKASQAAVDAIRGNGDNKLVMVPGYQWSAASTFPTQHPRPWITDPAGNVRYEAHHYWDRDGSGTYANSYAAEVADAQARGYSASTATGGTPTGGTPTVGTPTAGTPTAGTRRAVADFDGNGKTDVAIFRPSTGQWYVQGGNPAVTPWGVSGDIPVPGDYDGDGKTDMAIFRPSTGQWYIRTANPTVIAWGADGDRPVPGDYDGDGKTDVAIFRPSTGQWYIRTASPTVVAWGVNGDIPVQADYDGDGKADVAIFRPSTGQWFVRTANPTVIAWGTSGDIPVAADYDGDGKADVAIFRPSTGQWYLRTANPTVVAWGVNGDLPVPGDYDGDGKADVAIFRPSTGQWFVTGVVPTITVYGTSSDVVLALPPGVRLSL